MAVEEIDIASVPSTALDIEMRIVTLGIWAFNNVCALSWSKVLSSSIFPILPLRFLWLILASLFYDPRDAELHKCQKILGASFKWALKLWNCAALLHCDYFSLSEKSEGSEKAIKKGYYFYLLLSSSAILSRSKKSALPLHRVLEGELIGLKN